MRDFPWVNEDGAHDIGAKEVDQAVDMLWAGWLVIFTIAVLVAIAC